MSISTHVLDATTGRPAAGLELVLSRQDGGRWHELARRRTGVDGRVADLAPGATAGVHRIVFLICATGMSAASMLAALHARLGHDPATEREVVRDELTKIVRLRLARTFE